MNEVRYRTEAFSGSQERDAAEIMAFETFELGNTDVLEYLRDTVLGGTPLGRRCTEFIAEMDRNGYVDDMGTEEKVDFFREALAQIKESTGIDVKYALWLADKSVATNRAFYGRDMDAEDDFDCYEVGPVILADLGREGTLYGYPEMPVRLEDRIEDLQNRLTDVINEREGLPEMSKHGIALNEQYMDLDNQIREMQEILDRKTKDEPMPDRLAFSSVKDQLYDSLGNLRRGFEVLVYDKTSEGKWTLSETKNTLTGSDYVVSGKDGDRHLYFRVDDTLIALNANFSSPTCHRCYVIGREIPVTHKVIGNAVLAYCKSSFGGSYALRRQDYSDSPSFFYFTDSTRNFRVGHGDHDLPALLERLKKSFSRDELIAHSLYQLSHCLDGNTVTSAFANWKQFELLLGEVITHEEFCALDSLTAPELLKFDHDATSVYADEFYMNLQSIRSNADDLAYISPCVKVEWVNMDEGWWGDYNPENPKDENLLRFDVSVLRGGVWEAKEDASYCTAFPASASLAEKCQALQILGREYSDALSSDIEVSVKKLGERLSWISLDDLPMNRDIKKPSLSEQIQSAAAKTATVPENTAPQKSQEIKRM